MGKKNEGRFTIQFTYTDPAHLQVIEILNRLRPRSKAPYLVDAILHFENCTETPVIRRTPSLDEKAIEAIVRRVLAKSDMSVGNEATTTAKETRNEEPGEPTPISEDLDLDDAMEALGKDNLQAILGAVKAFRG